MSYLMTQREMCVLLLIGSIEMHKKTPNIFILQKIASTDAGLRKDVNLTLLLMIEAIIQKMRLA